MNSKTKGQTTDSCNSTGAFQEQDDEQKQPDAKDYFFHKGKPVRLSQIFTKYMGFPHPEILQSSVDTNWVSCN